MRASSTCNSSGPSRCARTAAGPAPSRHRAATAGLSHSRAGLRASKAGRECHGRGEDVPCAEQSAVRAAPTNVRAPLEPFGAVPRALSPPWKSSRAVKIDPIPPHVQDPGSILQPDPEGVRPSLMARKHIRTGLGPGVHHDQDPKRAPLWKTSIDGLEGDRPHARLSGSHRNTRGPGCLCAKRMEICRAHRWPHGPYLDVRPCMRAAIQVYRAGMPVGVRDPRLRSKQRAVC